MQKTKIIFTFFLLALGFYSFSQDSLAILKYINTYKNIAIAEMQRTGVPAAITIAQGIHETEAGTSDLVLRSNNHFGIKCKDTWAGPSVKHTDDRRNECFRKYSSAEESYHDHSDFLKSSDRYASLFQLDPMDYEGWAYGLKKAGYATNPKYAQLIIKLIEDYHLQDYTLIAMGKMKPQEQIIAKENPKVDVLKKDEKMNNSVVRSEQATVTNGFLNISSKAKDESLKQEIKQPEIKTEQPQYPTGEFKINDTKVIYAKQGTPFLAIAQQYNISLAWLYDFNDIKNMEAVPKDELIYLQRKRKTGNNEFHIVKSGETPYDIAQEEAIRLESLMEYNMLASGMQPAIGEKLYLHTKAPQRPQLTLKNDYSINNFQPTIVVNSSNADQQMNKDLKTQGSSEINKNNFFIYTVKPKETIWSIAQTNNVKIGDIVKWNGLAGYDLKTGQQLKIYK